METELRAAIVAEPPTETRNVSDLDAEQRERLTLRSTAKLTNYLLAAAGGRRVDGAEAELSAAEGVNGIPLALWDTPEAIEHRQRLQGGATEHRAVTPAPGTVGVNHGPDPPGSVRAQHRAAARHRHAPSGERNLRHRHNHSIRNPGGPRERRCHHRTGGRYHC